MKILNVPGTFASRSGLASDDAVLFLETKEEKREADEDTEA